jgi:class 3 adenylate cyclase/tetratricopeptide (TPR) repeat protein
MRCSNCGSENPAAKKFCEDCGAPLEHRCPECGAETTAGKRFCGECGSALAGSGATAQSPRSPLGIADITVSAEATDSAVPEGERKTVTALFADIKGSMELMEDLDPEEARAIVDPALKLMIDAVQRYGGYVVQSTGDGIFALFGAPVAHEDHPQRAVYAALRMQEEIRRYGDRMRAQGHTPIQVRIGVNTGEVVVRSIQTSDGHTEYAPIGHSTSLAARLQTLARPGSTVISGYMCALVEGYFQLKGLGPTVVKGVSDPVELFEVTGLGPLRTRLQRAASRGLTKFVGRENELAQMRRALELAKTGRGQIVAVVGEPGVGKSRLFYEFKATAASGCMLLEAYSVSHGKASAYLPLLELLHSYFEILPFDDQRKRRERVAGKILVLDRALEEELPYLYSLIGATETPDPLMGMDPQVRRHRTLEALKHVLLRESLNQPLIVQFEDLHWLDNETQAFLNLQADSIGTARVLLLVNYRPEHRHEWNSKTYYSQIRLDPLGREIAEELLAALLGRDAELLQVKRLLVEKTEGNPFFLEEMVRGLFEQGALIRNGSVKLGKSLDSIQIPVTVGAVLASRIDRLSAEEKNLLQTMAVIGTDFRAALLRKVAGTSEEALEPKITALQVAEFIYEQPAIADAEYTFKHALTQEVAYGSTLLERRKVLHERIGNAIETLYSDRLDDHLDDLARHFRRSGNTVKAVEYLRRAGERLAALAAVPSALEHFGAATDLLKTIEDPAIRDRQEAGICMAAASPTAFAFGEGSDERQRLVERAIELGSRLDDCALQFVALVHLAGIRLIRGDLVSHRPLLGEMTRIARDADDPLMATEASSQRAANELWSGNFAAALEDMERAISISAALSPSETRRFYWGPPEGFYAYVGLSRWFLGYPDQARASALQAVSIAREGHRDYFLVVAQFYLGLVHQLRREWEQSTKILEQATVLCDQRGFPLIAKASRSLHKIGLDHSRAEADHDSLMDFAHRASDDIQLGLPAPYILESCARSLAKLRRHDDARLVLEDAFVASRRGPRWFEAELHRTRGEIALLRDPNSIELAERSFRHAIELACQQSARSFELRATTSLARLLRDTGRRDQARAMLAEIYNWFTEGFDTADMKDAKALLDELASP